MNTLRGWYDSHLGEEFMQNRDQALAILQSEAELQEIVKLVGQDSLSPADQLTLETAKMLREDFLQQNAFMDVDSYSSYDRQARLLALMLQYDRLCRRALEQDVTVSALLGIEAKEMIGRAKYVPEDEYAEAYDRISRNMEIQIEELMRGAEDD